MSLITALEPQKKKKNRLNLYLDGEFVCGISAEAVLRHNLKAGDCLPPKIRDRIIEEEDLERHLNQAYRLLSYRPRTSKEIKIYLGRKGTPELLIEKVMVRLEEQGLVDDHQFARWWIEQRLQFRPKGVMVLKSELLQKGIERQVVDEVLANYESQIHSLAVIERLAQKAVRHYPGLNQKEKRLRLYQYLARRGFPIGLIKTTVDKVILST
jgi:regulatory protein